MTEFSFTLKGLVAHAWLTVQQPAEGLRALVALQLDRNTLWTSLALVTVISVILFQLDVLLDPELAQIAGMRTLPALMGVIQGCFLVVMVFAIYWIGQALGGLGGFNDAIVAVTWLQFIMVLIQVAQTVLILISPAVSGMLGIFGIGVFFYLLTYFIAAIHGFTSLARVFMMIIATLFGLSFVLTILLAVVGINVAGVQ